MTKISTSIVNQLIADSIKHGKSKQVPVEDSQIPYFRMLISKYNNVNKTKISARRVHGVYMEVCAPKDRFFDTDEFEIAFNLIQNVFNNEDYIITGDQFKIIKEKLKSIEHECEKRLSVRNRSQQNSLLK